MWFYVCIMYYRFKIFDDDDDDDDDLVLCVCGDGVKGVKEVGG